MWMKAWLGATLSVCIGRLVVGEIDPNAKGDPLFPEDHPNVTYMTDDNFNEKLAQDDRPWLVDYYHPFCPHCKHFVPTYTEVAAHYAVEKSVHIGAISCMDHVKCRQVGIKGFPTLIFYNFKKKYPGETFRVVGTHTFQEVVDLVDKQFLEAKINETGTQPPSEGAGGANLPAVGEAKAEEQTPKPGEQKRKEIWEESTKPSNKTTRIQDAASAFIFGLKQGVFMGREVLEDAELDALKAWLQLVSQTFPGAINRKIVANLHSRVADKALLDFDTWDGVLKEWQGQAEAMFQLHEAVLNFTNVDVPEWQRLPDLFLGNGNTYRACALYTCGQWNMFHMLTMNPPEEGVRSSELMVSVIATIRRFMKHFFGCVQCRDHFLEYNNLEMVKKIAKADDKVTTLRRWLWEMHNAVNKRLVHPVWPKPDICPTCGEDGNWNEAEVDKWLDEWYAYHDVQVPEKTAAPTPNPSPTPTPTSTQSEKNVLRSEEDENPGAYKPKSAEQNHERNPQVAHARVQNFNVGGHAGIQTPPMSLFAWYAVPVVAVAAYMIFVRSRGRTRFPRPHHANE